MLESSILDNFKIIFKDRSFILPPHVDGTLTIHSDKIDLWINEHPFYKGVWELTKFFNNNKDMFTIEATTEDGIIVRLEKCVIYTFRNQIPGRAADPEDRAKITGIGVISLNVKWYY